MGMTAPGLPAATRALAVLAVLIGLLAMHGLTSTHHAAAATTSAQHHPAPADASPVHHHAAGAAVVHDNAALADSPGASCDETCPDLAVLCIAVLTGAALALLLARRRSSPLLPSSDRPRGPAPAPAVRHTQGPDPVRELCVSRT